jgi:hypothetical protein
MSRSIRRVRIAVAVTALLASIALVPSAQAAPDNGSPSPLIAATFCPTSGTIGLQASGSPNNTDRCAGSYRGSLNWVEAQNFTTSVMKCAALKPNPDGSGANVGGIAAACNSGTSSARQWHSPPRNGYPTIINQGANYHTGFSGVEDHN